MHAARRGRRHRDDVVAAVAAAHDRALDRLVILQIVRRHDAAGFFHRVGDPRGDRALVEGARAALGNRLQRVGEIELDQPVAGVQRLAAVLEQNARRRRPAPQPLGRLRQRIGGIVFDRKALLCQAYGRCDQIGERQFAGTVLLLRQCKASNGSRHADGKPGIARLRRIGLAFGVEEHGRRGGRRRGLAIVDGGVAAIQVSIGFGEMDHHEAAAADIAGARIGHRQREADRDRGIDRVAARDRGSRRRCGRRGSLCATTMPLWARMPRAAGIAGALATGATWAKASDALSSSASVNDKVRVIIMKVYASTRSSPAEAGTQNWILACAGMSGRVSRARRHVTSPVRDRPCSAACRWRKQRGSTC